MKGQRWNDKLSKLNLSGNRGRWRQVEVYDTFKQAQSALNNLRSGQVALNPPDGYRYEFAARRSGTGQGGVLYGCLVDNQTPRSTGRVRLPWEQSDRLTSVRARLDEARRKGLVEN